MTTAVYKMVGDGLKSLRTDRLQPIRQLKVRNGEHTSSWINSIVGVVRIIDFNNNFYYNCRVLSFIKIQEHYYMYNNYNIGL